MSLEALTSSETKDGGENGWTFMLCFGARVATILHNACPLGSERSGRKRRKKERGPKSNV